MDGLTLGHLGVSGSVNLPIIGLASAAILLFLAGLALRVWSKYSSSHQNVGNSLSDLYLGMDFKVQDSTNCKQRGYLRSLTLNRASLVSSGDVIQRGALLEIDLGSLDSLALPPSQGKNYVPAKVVKRKSLGGNPESWLLDVKFTRQPCNEASDMMSIIKKTSQSSPSNLH